MPSRRALLLGGAAAALAATGGGYLARPRTQGRGGLLVPELLRVGPFYVAHRGGSKDWPEMSMEAYRQAVALGVDALEISLARSSDGVWFGLHDDTLDRTSGTSGFVASQHPWSEISRLRISAAGTREGGDPQPYLRFEDLVTAYAGTHTLFVDPKVTEARHYPELLDIITSVPRPDDTFVAKAYCTGTRWGKVARAAGLRTWGYYYGREIESGATPPEATQASWDLLGLDVKASAAAWTTMRGFGKPIVGHVVADADQADRVTGNGAQGLMVSSPIAVLDPWRLPWL